MTDDHTFASELARHGVIKPADVPRNPYRHVVTNVIGGKDVGVRVDVETTDLRPGDALLLCSDGLSDMLSDEGIARVLSAEPDPEAACGRLVAEANGAGGQDNITAIVARFEAA